MVAVVRKGGPVVDEYAGTSEAEDVAAYVGAGTGAHMLQEFVVDDLCDISKVNLEWYSKEIGKLEKPHTGVPS